MKLEDLCPIVGSVAVTPSDTVDLTVDCRALLVTTAGLVKVTYQNGAVDAVHLSAGVWHPMYVRRVWAATTAATGIHAGY